MKKEEQRIINDSILREWEKAKQELERGSEYTIHRLRSCSAEVLTTEHYHFLKSYNTIIYNTIIAFIDKNTDTCYDVLRYVYGYTSTSGQHIAKFSHDYGHGKWGCTTELRYYPV